MFVGFLADPEGFTASRKSQRAVSRENELLELCACPLPFHKPPEAPGRPYALLAQVQAAGKRGLLTMKGAGTSLSCSLDILPALE